jgi:hypothetical protein
MLYKIKIKLEGEVMFGYNGDAISDQEWDEADCQQLDNEI